MVPSIFYKRFSYDEIETYSNSSEEMVKLHLHTVSKLNVYISTGQRIKILFK